VEGINGCGDVRWQMGGVGRSRDNEGYINRRARKEYTSSKMGGYHKQSNPNKPKQIVTQMHILCLWGVDGW